MALRPEAVLPFMAGKHTEPPSPGKLLCAKKELAATRRDAHHGASMFKHLIWDWNGTLLDDAAACVAAINTLLARRRLPQVSRQQYLDVFDFPVRNYYLQLGFDFAREDWDRLTEEYHAEYAETSRQSPLRAGTQAALAALQAAGLSLSVLSASEWKPSMLFWSSRFDDPPRETPDRRGTGYAELAAGHRRNPVPSPT
jgi:hypothetical protein